MTATVHLTADTAQAERALRQATAAIARLDRLVRACCSQPAPLSVWINRRHRR